MPTASNLGLVEESSKTFPTKLEAGMSLEIKSLPIFREASPEFEFESVVLETVEQGDFYTTSKIIMGSLKSETPKSTGYVLRRAIESNNTLTAYIDTTKTNTGKTGLSIGLYKTQNYLKL